MSDPRAMSPDLLREVIREVVREVIREVVAEEVAAAGLAAAARQSGPQRSGQRSPSTAPAAGGRLERGALTERHVRAVGREGSIVIGRAVVVTPLAKERAKSMGIEIIRIEE